MWRTTRPTSLPPPTHITLWWDLLPHLSPPTHNGLGWEQEINIYCVKSLSFGDICYNSLVCLMYSPLFYYVALLFFIHHLHKCSNYHDILCCILWNRWYALKVFGNVRVGENWEYEISYEVFLPHQSGVGDILFNVKITRSWCLGSIFQVDHFLVESLVFPGWVNYSILIEPTVYNI